MRLHTNTLETWDAYAAAYGSHSLSALMRPTAGGLPGVGIEATARGSRSHTRSLDVYLTGTSTRRPNGRDADDYAATWDEWGMFLARLFAADPTMVAGTVARPIYANAEHFRWVTGGRYDTLTPDAQHRNHRWEFSGRSAAGAYMVHECSGGPAPCGAIRRFANSTAWLADNGMVPAIGTAAGR